MATLADWLSSLTGRGSDPNLKEYYIVGLTRDWDALWTRR